MSENYITSQFSVNPIPQDLFHHYALLIRSKDSTLKPLNAIERMGRLCCFRAEDLLSVIRICRWSEDGFLKFIDVLTKFERYETKDSTGSGYGQRINKGLKCVLTNVVIRKLGKCPEETFVANIDNLMNYNLSKRELADKGHQMVEIEKVSNVLSKIAEFVPIDNLRVSYPGIFEDENLKDLWGLNLKIR